MNKEAYLKGYMYKRAFGENNVSNEYVKIDKVLKYLDKKKEKTLNKPMLQEKLSEILSNPSVRLASYAPEVLGVLGAGTGAYIGHKLSKDENDSEKEKERPEFSKIFAGSMTGGALGATTGNAIRNRTVWNRIRKMLKEL